MSNYKSRLSGVFHGDSAPTHYDGLLRAEARCECPLHSDIRPFLASGVPADVTRAALRRAWSTDPAIREFIGLSENSWDFNAPGGVSGFGPLTTDASSRLLARTMEETESFDPERPGAERLTHDQAPVLTGEALQAAGPGQVK